MLRTAANLSLQSSAADAPGVWAPEHGDCRHDLRQDPLTPLRVWLAAAWCLTDPSGTRCQRLGSAARARIGERPEDRSDWTGLDQAASVSPSDGAPGAGRLKGNVEVDETHLDITDREEPYPQRGARARRARCCRPGGGNPATRGLWADPLATHRHRGVASLVSQSSDGFRECAAWIGRSSRGVRTPIWASSRALEPAGARRARARCSSIACGSKPWSPNRRPATAL